MKNLLAIIREVRASKRPMFRTADIKLRSLSGAEAQQPSGAEPSRNARGKWMAFAILIALMLAPAAVFAQNPFSVSVSDGGTYSTSFSGNYSGITITIISI
jgi:hypothetical protein